MTNNVNFETSDSRLKRLFDCAERKATGNIRDYGGRRVMIEGGSYNGLWLETQPMGGEMYAARDPEVALNNQLMFIENIREDGRIPAVLRYVDGRLKLCFEQFQGYCFPYHAVNMYYNAGLDRAYLETLYSALERFDAYLWRTRDSDCDGCLESWCVYDTGEDNSTRFYGAPSKWASDEPPIGVARLPYESLDIMGYSYDGRNALADISALLGDGREEYWRKKAVEVSRRVAEYLWREERGACFDRDGNNVFFDTLTHNNLRAMYHGMFTREMAGRFVREHLLNTAEFWTPMPLPSIAANAPLYHEDEHNNWSGQPQGLTYQRAIRALENYGYYPLITTLGRKLTEALYLGEREDGEFVFTQQYDTRTGSPAASWRNTDYGPAILAFLGYTARLHGVTVVRDRLIWGALGESESVYTQLWRGNEYRLECDGKTARGSVNGREVFVTPCGVRAVTGLDGRGAVYFDITDGEPQKV